MNISQNIQKILKEQKRTQKELASHLGIAKSTINNWIKLNRSVPSEYIIPVCEFLNISPYYLLNGEENNLSIRVDNTESDLLNMYNQLSEKRKAMVYERTKTLFELEQQEKIPPITHKRRINIAEVAAGAGTSTPFTIDDAFSPQEFPEEVIPAGADCGVPINGDSMEPEYPNGCIVWVDCSAKVSFGDVVIAIYNGEPYCKIYQQGGLYSYNKDYNPIKVHEFDSVSIFGKVIGYYVED